MSGREAFNIVRSSLRNNVPVHYHLMTGRLPGYTGNYGHYVVGYGYRNTDSEWTYPYNYIETDSYSDKAPGYLFYNDPWKSLGHQHTTSSNLLNAVDENAGFIICR